MRKFSHIIHLDNISHFYSSLEGRFNRKIKKRPQALMRDFFEWLTPVVWKEFEITSKTGQTVGGALVLCPLLPDQMASLPPDRVKNKILSSCRVGKWWGAEIIGLGGFTSIASDQGEGIEFDLPLTTGNTYTALMGAEEIISAANIMGIDFNRKKLAVLGAGGDIGSACAKVLSNYFSNITLAGRRMENLQAVAEEIKKNKPEVKIEISTDSNAACKEAGVVLSAVSAVAAVVDPKLLKPGTIFCDIAIPKTVARGLAEERGDVFVFDGGMARPPSPVDLADETETAPDIIFGCLAESAILALEGRLEKYSIGRGKITTEKMEEMKALGIKHGFSQVPFRTGKKAYTPDEIRRFKEIIRKGEM